MTPDEFRARARAFSDKLNNFLLAQEEDTRVISIGLTAALGNCLSTETGKDISAVYAYLSKVINHLTTN